MLQVVLPLADVHVAACEDFGALAFHLTVLELSLVASLVGPDHDTLPLHVVVVELALIELARVRKVVLASAVELAVEEVAFIKTALELKPSLARLLSKHEGADEADLAKVPRLGTLTVLLVVLPLTVIHAAAGVNKDTVSIGLAIFPLSLENVTVSMSHTALAIECAVLRLSIVV